MSKAQALKIIRTTAALILTLVLSIFLLPKGFRIYKYLTVWAFIFTTCYFLLMLLGYLYTNIYKILPWYFCILWGLNWAVTIIYWPIIFVNDPTELHEKIMFHSLPLIFTILEFLFNKAKFERKFFMPCIYVIICYSVFYIIYVIVKEKAIYKGIDFESGLIYPLFIVFCVFAYAFLEAGRFFKLKLITLEENIENLEYKAI
ncbi:hypothetical protein SteCoe_21508 [Stentor coeruleus]|uniref:Uncharacterized protein n=1 Tax=Stentor coeruleus TaxID=5963 RepID=A0A1R2BPE7_9CILI|nr:hypothetical protein SteCoe_21508 [Stentor coeruleus]